MYKELDIEIVRTIYYFVQEDDRCLKDKRRRSGTIELLAKSLGIKPAAVGEFAGQFVSATLDFGLALKARYLWVETAKQLAPRVALYRTTRGPIFAVYGSRKIVKRFKRGGNLTDLSCTPNLALPKFIPEELMERTNLALKEYGFTIQKLLGLIDKGDV